MRVRRVRRLRVVLQRAVVRVVLQSAVDIYIKIRCGLVIANDDAIF